MLYILKLLYLWIIFFRFEAMAEEALDIFKEIKNTSQEMVMLEDKQSNAMNKQLFIFISLSMPKDSLKQLMNQVKQHNGTLVIRGLHEGSFKHTVSALYKINKEGVNAVIDPTLFEKYGITSVPTFILNGRGKVDKVVGNVPLSYALELFKSQGETGGIQ